jgi:hypothetical protein
MINTKILATMSLGLLVAACAQPYQQQSAYQASYPAAYPAQSSTRALSVSERNCIDYGFASPSANYDRCVQREMRSRDQGRVARDYNQSRLVQDASNACYDYGLERNSQRFENCVNREVDARRYREQGPTPAPVAYYQPQPAPYYAPQPAPAPFRDEFGFRYDGEGNRLDASGRVISPYSTNR